GAHDNPSIRADQLLDRGQGGANTPVVSDAIAVEWNVEVGAHQHAPTLYTLGQQIVKILHGLLLVRSGKLRTHQRGQVSQPVGITPLVVVPADDLDLVADDLGQR